MRMRRLQLLLLSFVTYAASFEHSVSNGSTPSILSPFGSYPNVLDIDESTRKQFHPIVKFPQQCWVNETFVCPFSDYSKPNPQAASQLLESDAFHRRRPWWKPIVSAVRRFWHTRTPARLNTNIRYIGRYDEDRVGLYTSELFVGDNRTVHVGIDLVGPVGTPVFNFDDGRVFAAGYNSVRGDYGHVVVVEYESLRKSGGESVDEKKPYYVLFGHLDAASSTRHKVGQSVRKGAIIGWMGDAWENGGWTSPHAHVQISTQPPETHDMPGAVSYQDRHNALLVYPDPRYIVGALH